MNTKKLAQYLKKSRKENSLYLKRTGEGLLITDKSILVCTAPGLELQEYWPQDDQQYLIRKGEVEREAFESLDYLDVEKKWGDWSTVEALGQFTPTQWLYEMPHYKEPSEIARRLVWKEEPERSTYFDRRFLNLFDEDPTNLRDLYAVWRLERIHQWPDSKVDVLRVMRSHSHYEYGKGNVVTWCAEGIIMPFVFTGSEREPVWDIR